MSETRPVRILRALAAAPDGLSTPAIEATLAEGIEPRQRALTWYGSILRRKAQEGHVEKIGKTVGSWQNCPAFIWRITDEGVSWLAYVDDQPRREAAYAEAVAEAEEAVSRRRAALAQAAETYSRATPRIARRAIALNLRSLGCMLEEIGDVFGVTREMIRQDLLWDPAAIPSPKPGTPRVRGQRLKEVSVQGDVMVITMGKRTVYFTREEAQEVARASADWGHREVN